MCKILTFSEVTLKSILACFYRTFEVLKFGGKLVVKDKQMLVKSTSATCHINNQYNLDHNNGVRRHMTRSTYFCQKKVLIFAQKKYLFLPKISTYFCKNKYYFSMLALKNPSSMRSPPSPGRWWTWSRRWWTWSRRWWTWLTSRMWFFYQK